MSPSIIVIGRPYVRLTLSLFVLGIYSFIPLHHALADGYVMSCGSNAVNPADAGTYYWCKPETFIMTGSSVKLKSIVPVSGTITKITGFYLNNTVLGTNEISTTTVQINGTDMISIANFDNSTTRSEFPTATYNQAVTAGDTIQLKWTTPTWATNPTGVSASALLYIETAVSTSSASTTIATSTVTVDMPAFNLMSMILLWILIASMTVWLTRKFIL